MNKAKQIWAILFPDGLLFSYFPAGICIGANGFLAFFDATGGASDLLLLVNCIGIVGGLKIGFDTWRYKRHVRAEQEFIRSVLEDLTPQLKQIHTEFMNAPDCMSANKIFEMMAKSHTLIDEEVKRRRSPAQQSKLDKT